MSEEIQQTKGQETAPDKVRPMREIKRLMVKINQEEIDGAIRGKSNKCMIHQSIARDYPELKNIWVDKNQVRVTDPGRNVIYRFDMPAVGRANILLWDQGTAIKPFYIILRNPVMRERVFRAGAMRPKSSQDASSKHRGAVVTPKTKEARAMSGRDRVYGAKLWSEELTKLRELVTS